VRMSASKIFMSRKTLAERLCAQAPLWVAQAAGL
jgi:hypothetical protein